MTSVLLPAPDGSLQPYEPQGSRLALPSHRTPPRTRTAYAAAHVVVDPRTTVDPALDPRMDWDATLAFRHHLWDLGLGVAEAMDTAQRGMGLPGNVVRELIERSSAEASARGGLIACGAATDTVRHDVPVPLAEIEEAYLEQCGWIEGAGSRVVLMASRALCRSARSAEDYLTVCSTVLAALDRPAVLHWLGDMFDPLLRGYWGSEDLDEATETVLELIASNPTKVEGIKMSLLDADREIDLRRRLPEGVRMYTGDDFNFPELIQGDGRGHSHALLGAFDAIAPIAAEGLARLDDGDLAGYRAVMDPTVPLSRAIFESPTYHYKTGVVFLAYLRGLQSHFTMLGGLQGARSINHLAQLFRLADQAGLLVDVDLAVERLRPVLQTSGIDTRSPR